MACEKFRIIDSKVRVFEAMDGAHAHGADVRVFESMDGAHGATR